MLRRTDGIAKRRRMPLLPRTERREELSSWSGLLVRPQEVAGGKRSRRSSHASLQSCRTVTVMMQVAQGSPSNAARDLARRAAAWWSS